MPAKKETVYFINEDDLNMGWLANDRQSANEWFNAFLDNLEENEPAMVNFVKRKMTQKQIDDLPEI